MQIKQTKSTAPAPVPFPMRDEALIALIADDDKDALKTFYLRHQARVFRFVMRIVSNKAVAEEITNDVFLEVWRKAHQFQARSRAATWLLAIAHHRAISAIRRRSNAQLDDEFPVALEDPGDSADAVVDKHDRSAMLDRCLTKLTPQHREVIKLVYYQEKKIDEVARLLSVPVNTIKTRMFYARNRMAQLLAEAGVDRSWVAI
jgi:RNA polymerase sigma-70 factor (ECF subfamily)